MLRGSRLPLPAATADRYAKRLEWLVAQMTAETERELTRLFKHPDVQEYVEGFAADISPASQARILTNKLKEKFEQLFRRWDEPTAATMVDQANKASATATYNSLKDLSGGLSLSTKIVTGPMREFMTATIAQNVSLIKSIPSQYFQKIQGEILRAVTKGRGLEDLQPFFEAQRGITERRARMIAHDQTHKTFNGLNRGRMQAVGVKEFEWVHSGGGQHPRILHIEMSGKTFRFDAPPVIEEDGERGFPGDAVNCRCTMIPVIRFDKGDPVD